MDTPLASRAVALRVSMQRALQGLGVLAFALLVALAVPAGDVQTMPYRAVGLAVCVLVCAWIFLISRKRAESKLTRAGLWLGALSCVVLAVWMIYDGFRVHTPALPGEGRHWMLLVIPILLGCVAQGVGMAVLGLTNNADAMFPDACRARARWMRYALDWFALFGALAIALYTSTKLAAHVSADFPALMFQLCMVGLAAVCVLLFLLWKSVAALSAQSTLPTASGRAKPA